MDNGPYSHEHVDLDMQDIARGRRITAVTASELALVPRKGDRPPRGWKPVRMWKRLMFRLESVKYDG